MSKIWPSFTKENPCPSCGHFGNDWCCRAGNTHYVCMRIASDRVAKDGGYIHPYGGKKPTYIPPARPAPKVVMDFEKLHCCMMRADWTSLGNKLGVSDESLSALDVRYHAKESAWAIPMRDGENKIIGIHLRSDDGSKKAVTGSRNGLFIPSSVGELIERNKLKT